MFELWGIRLLSAGAERDALATAVGTAEIRLQFQYLVVVTVGLDGVVELVKEFLSVASQEV